MSLADDLQTQLTQVKAAITAALASAGPNYRVGEVAVNKSDYLKTLFDQQNTLIEQLAMIPAEQIDTVQSKVDEFGNDLTDYKNEARIS